MAIKKIKNNTASPKTWCGMTIAPGEYYTIESIEESIWSNDSAFFTAIGNAEAVVNNGTLDITDVNSAINWMKEGSSLRPMDGRIFTNASPRPLGTILTLTSIGDSTASTVGVGGGNKLDFVHTTGDSTSQEYYINFNVKENRTFIKEGYLTCKDCALDSITLSVVPCLTTYTSSSNTYFNLYNGVIIPAAGDGNIQVDATNMRLVEFPPGLDFGDSKTCFWNADYDSVTHTFSNISAAPYGNGKYNMFGSERILGCFANRLSLLGTQSQSLSTEDTYEIGQGMLIKVLAETKAPDHDWIATCTLTLYRAITC